MNYEIKRFDSTFWELNLKERENPELIKLLKLVPGISKINKCSDYTCNIHLGEVFDPDLVEKSFKKVLFNYYAFKGAVWKEDPGIHFDKSKLLRCPECHEIVNYCNGDIYHCSNCYSESSVSQVEYYRKGYLKGLDDNLKYGELVVENTKNVIIKHNLTEENQKLEDKLIMMESKGFYRENQRLRKDNMELSKKVADLKDEIDHLNKHVTELIVSRNYFKVEAQYLKKKIIEIKRGMENPDLIISRLKSEISDLFIELGGKQSDVDELKSQVKRIFGE